MLLKSSSYPSFRFLNPCVPHQDTLKEVDFQCDSPSIHGFIPRIVPCHHHGSLAKSFIFHGARQSPLEVEDATGATWEIDRGPVARHGLRRVQSEGELASPRDGVARKNGVSSFVNSWLGGTQNFADNSSSRHRQWSRRMKHIGCHTGSINATFGVGRRDFILEESDISATGQVEHQANDSMHSREGQEQLAGFLPADVRFRDLERKNTEFLLHKAQYDGNEQASVATESRKRTGTFEMEDGEVYTSFSVDRNGTPVVCNSRGCRPLTQSEKVSPMCIGIALGLATEGGHFGGSNHSDGTIGGFGADPNSTEAYYRKWLQDDPQNALLLTNFAKFLYEVKHDYREAETLYERSILASPTDGDVLSQYAKLVWDVHRDEDRAEIYYNKAVQAAPDDCYVMGSYASFAWDSEDNEQSNNPSSSLDTQSGPLIQTTPRLVASA